MGTSHSVIGKTIDISKPIQIIGAGMAGLFMAYYLKKKNIPFVIFEKKQCGGLIQSLSTTNGIIEKAANGIIYNQRLELLCKEIGIKPIFASKEIKKKWIIINGVKYAVPPPQANVWRSVIYSLFRKHKSTETVKTYFDTFFSKALSENLISPALVGIYANYANNLSLPLVFPNLHNKLSKPKFGFRLLSTFNNFDKGSVSFEGGMQTLANALKSYLKDELIMEAFLPNTDNTSQQIICTNAHEAALLVASDTTIASLLNEVHYQNITTITVFTKKENLPQGIGCLYTANDINTCLGVLFNHHIFSQHYKKDILSFTIIINNDFNSFDYTQAEKEIRKILLQIFQKDLKILSYEVTNWTKGIPLYNPQLYNNLQILQKELQNKPYVLFGNYTGQISLRGMMQSAELYVDSLIK